MHFLRNFWRKSRRDVCLIPNTLTDRPVTSNDESELSMGVFKWLGTNGGDAETWINPCYCGLSRAIIFQPTQRPSNEEKKNLIVKGDDGEDIIGPDPDILNGKKVGARVTIDTGVQLVTVWPV